MLRFWHSYTESAMPIYEYRCARGHQFDVLQRMTDDWVTECTDCGAPVERVFRAPAVHFKGSDFYTTDYPKKGRGGGSSDDGGGSDDGAAGDKKDKKDTKDNKDKKTESKTAAGTSRSDSSSSSSSD